MLRAILRRPVLRSVVAFLLARRVIVRGWSMYPTLAPGERVLFDTLAYRLGAPQAGDVVLARHPARPGLKLVKRVAAVPGDRPPAVETSNHRASASGETPSLAEDEYLLLGDAPDLSTDGRHLGPTRREDIQGRAWLVYWPPHRMRVVRGPRPD